MILWLWVCGVVGVGGCGVAGLKKQTKRKSVTGFGWKSIPKAIHKSVESHLKSIQNLTESKQGPHKSGTPETPGSQDTRNRIKIVLGESLGAGSVVERQGSQMDLN